MSTVKLHLLFRIFLCLAGGGFFTISSQAQTQKQMHQQNYGKEKPQVHAQGNKKVSRSFWDIYKTPKTIFKYGEEIDTAFFTITAGGLFWYILLSILLLYFIIFNRYKKGRRAFYTHGTDKKYSKVKTFLDVAVFISLDLVIWVFSFKATGSPFGSDFGFIWKNPSGPDVVRVQVMPQQWAWNFRYPGEDKTFGTKDDIYTVNELIVPKDKKVNLQLKSRDVIHGFWIPNVRMQIDALPSQISRMWFEANQTGDFEIVCAHLCGTHHYKMKAFLKVVEENEYTSWKAEMSSWAQASYDQENQKKYTWGWTWQKK